MRSRSVRLRHIRLRPWAAKRMSWLSQDNSTKRQACAHDSNNPKPASGLEPETA